MKKVFLFAAASLFVLASCKKDYTCVCTDGTDSESFTYKDVKKKDAKEACDAQQALYNGFGATDVKCDIN